jgi:hypothetical protein
VVPADLASTLQAAAWATYVAEGRAGGISLIITLYQADQQAMAGQTRPG